MFLPPQGSLSSGPRKVIATEEQPVLLRSEHLVLHKTIRDSVFGDDSAIYLVYYPSEKKLMLAPYFNELFRNIHKARQHMLKEVSGGREYAVALHGVLLDHEIPNQDRYLPFEADAQMNVLTIYL